jgi:hypothetical protein
MRAALFAHRIKDKIAEALDAKDRAGFEIALKEANETADAILEAVRQARNDLEARDDNAYRPR